MASFAEAAIKFTADNSSLNKGLAEIQKAVGEAAAHMSHAVSVSMVAIGATVAAGATGLAFLVKQSADAGDELNKMSQRVGIGVETLSTYKLAAGLAGVELGDLGTSLQRASKNIMDAYNNTGTAADALDALGISARASGGGVKSVDQVMLEVADKFKGMEDGAQKTAMAMEIFGKSGASMIPLLNAGGAAIAKQRKEAEQLGMTWTKASAQMAEDFNDNFERIGFAMAGFRDAVANYLMPFVNEFLVATIAKIKEWSASGDLKAWALNTAEAILGAFVWAAEAVATVASASTLVVDGFRGVMVAVKTLESGFEAAIGGMLNGVAVLVNGLAGWAHMFGLPSQGLLDLEAKIRGVTDTMTTASQQAADSAVGWNDAIGSNNAAAEKFSGTIKGMAGTFRDWAATAVKSGSLAAQATGDAVKKAAGPALQSAKEQAKAMEETFKVLSTSGAASLQDGIDYLTKRAALFRRGTPEQLHAQAEVEKATKDMTERLFEHQKTMGTKSLQDEIAFQQRKAAAAVAGSQEKMKADEAAYTKEQELRDKSNSAALGLIGQAAERLKAKGYDVASRGGIENEIAQMQWEMGRDSRQTEGWANSGTRVMGLDDILRGYRATGALNTANRAGLGSVSDIFRQGAGLDTGVGPSGRTSSLGAATGIDTGYGTAMDAAVSAVDTGLSKIEARVNDSSSKIAQTIYGNVEQFFVRTLMAQAERA
jgi:hypothetical protein